MFCTKCGMKIDDDSTFCTYCGARIKSATTVIEAVPDPSNGILALYAKPIFKKIIVGLVLGLAVFLVGLGVVKLQPGLGKTLPEEIFAMSWEEISDLSFNKMKEMLNEEGTLYDSGEEDDIWEFRTKTLDSFMGVDCLYGHGFADDDLDIGFASLCSAQYQYTILDLAFESDARLKKFKKGLEESLEKQMIDNSIVFMCENDYGEEYIYAVEISDKEVHLFKNYNVGYDMDLDGCSAYKFVKLFFAKSDEMSLFELDDFPGNKSYIDYMCEVTVFYTPMTQKEFIALAAAYNYDAIFDKNIDFSEVRESLKSYSLADMISNSDDALRSLYFVENHNMDIKSNMDVSTDELKKIWYIRNWGWNNETKDFIDFSDYNNSREIYCAVTFSYNVDDDTYFEGDIEKAIYLSEKNYNLYTGESFVSEVEKRLYFLENFNYDIVSKKIIDREIVDALIAYQKYMDENDCNQCLLIYLDDNDIPELISNNILVCYNKGTIIENETFDQESVYVKRTGNLKTIYSGAGGNADCCFYHLENGRLEKIGSCGSFCNYDGDSMADSTVTFYINDTEVSEQDRYNFEKQFTEQMGEPLINIDYVYSNVLAAYDALEDGMTANEGKKAAEREEHESEVIDIYSLDWKQLFCNRISEETYLNKADKVYYSITDMNNDGVPELSYVASPGSGGSLTMYLCGDTKYPVKQMIGASLYKDRRVYCMDSSVNAITTYWVYEWNEKTLDYDKIFMGSEKVSGGYDVYGTGYDIFEYTVNGEECSMDVWYDAMDALDWGEEKAYYLTPIEYENVVSGSDAIEALTRLIRNY